MESIRAYLLSVTSAAMICGFITRLLGKKGTVGAITKLLCGMFLTVSVVNPFVEWKFVDLELYLSDMRSITDEAVRDGVEDAREELYLGIKNQAEAYILDKSTQYNVDLEVDIMLTEDALPVPAQVRICGDVSPYVKNLLANMIESDLGISREAQRWIG